MTGSGRWLDKLAMQIRMLFRRDQAGVRLDEELQFHLEQQIAENLTAGMNTEEARRAALRSFGNPAALRDQARATWSWRWLELILRDLRFGVRTLARTPGFSAVAILVMGLGIGANVALFTVVRSVLLKPLPFKDPSRLLALYGHSQTGPSKDESGNLVAAGDFYDWQKASRGFEQMAIWRWTGYNMSGNAGELPEFLNAGTGSWNLFSTLGVQPAIGRSFIPDDDRIGAGRTVVLAWSFFQRRFNGDPSVIGKTIRLNALQYTVIGVLPKWFTYPDPKIRLWVPYRIEIPAILLNSHFGHSSQVVARLKPGVSAESATQEVSAVQHQLYLRFHGTGPIAEGALSRPLFDDVLGDVKTPLYVLMGAVACLLLIACLNLSNLLVARGAARRKEMAIRTALGSGRASLIRQQLMESLLICVAAAVLGMLLASVATHWLVTRWAQMPRADTVRPDGIVLAFAIGITLLAGILAGVLPALSATGGEVLVALQSGARGTAARAGLRKALLTTELALTVVLLVGAGLLLKSFLRLRSVELGCATKNVLTMNFFLRGDKYVKPEQIVAFQTQLLDKVRNMPGITAAGLTNCLPGGGHYGDTGVVIPEHPPLPPEEHPFAMFRTADPGYFSAMEIPLIKGRFFSEDERLDHDRFVIINQDFVRRFFPTDDPIGKHLQVRWRSASGENYEIVGVVGDTLWQVGQPVRPMMWFPILSGLPNYSSDAELAVRSPNDVAALAIPIQKVIAQLDPDLPVKEVLTMEEIVGKSTANSSFNAMLLLCFAVISLVLAAVGLFGVLSFVVAQRTTEIGIRIALGAQRDQVVRLMLGDGLRPAMIGLVLGLIASAGLTHLIKSMLYGTQALDPVVFVLVGGTLLLVAAVACAVPAWRASQLDPMTALRMD